MLCADVILPLAIDSLTYAVPEGMTVGAGMLVSVPVGESKKYTGMVCRVYDGTPAFDCKDIYDVLTAGAVATEQQIRLWRWIADYYLSPLGDVFTAAMPAMLRKKTVKRKGGIAAVPSFPPAGKVSPLSAAQSTAYKEITETFKNKDVTLLHGVTSSGKTEIYIHLINDVLARGGQVLYLLPEIALTVQIRERLGLVFGDRLCVYHSKTTDDERAEIWNRLLETPDASAAGHRQGQDASYGVILGARSAVFLPFRRLGLIIIDEEHDASFKQQDHKPRYHARSVALMLARMYGAKTLLGTATPSAESYRNAMTGKYGLVTLSQRYENIELPEVKVVDMRDLRRRKMLNGPFSPLLIESIRETIDNGRQVILFQNRRGFAPMIECRTCGWVPRCTYCDVSLTYHKRTGQLTCHYCGHSYSVPEKCPCCGNDKLTARGVGTEKIEENISGIFPQARVARMDMDTTKQKDAHEHIISDFAAGRTDILIGTQMITKGLDFDRVSVVGILNADMMLNMPDFRAHEQAFTMMAQVAGRAGRKGRRGTVILQTYTPDAPVIRHVVNNTGRLFFDELFEERAAFRYPPFYRLIDIYLRHRENAVVQRAATELGRALRQWFGQRILGPESPVVARVKGLSIQKIMLKIEPGLDLSKVRQCLREEARKLNKTFSTVQIHFDVDP